MTENGYRFEVPNHRRSIIKVMGVGGGGSNAVNSMSTYGIKDVSFVVCNTDAQALESSPIQNKLQIGIHLTAGLGAGANPEVGKNAALESKEDIKAILGDGTKMLFITAGMGGGTGTGAAPVIASISKKMGILTVGIVTLPFSFEGRKKLQQAEEGIEQLRQHCDTVLVILNDRLKSILGNLSIGSAFAHADNVLTTAAKSIAEVITVPGYVNVDFEDVKTVMKDAGAAVMGSAQAEGEERALAAAKAALASPLLDYKDIHGAKKVLLSIMSGCEAELQMDELSSITDYIQEQVGVDAEMIFGHGSDVLLKEKIRVTVIATGFDKKVKEHVEEEVKRAPSTTDGVSEHQGSLFVDGSVHEDKQVPRGRRARGKKASRSVEENMLPFDEVSRYGLSQASSGVRGNTQHKLSDAQFREWAVVPAYQRRSVRLEEVDYTQTSDAIFYDLNKDNDEDQ